MVEELNLENLYRNPGYNYSIWDGIMYEMARSEPNIELLHQLHLLRLRDGRRAHQVGATGWQMTTQTFHEVHAALFADCSGDSVLAPLTGAEFRVGREARAEFGEDIAPEQADSRTMGMSCMLQAREENRPCDFTPPEVGVQVHARGSVLTACPTWPDPCENFWYLELGGDGDSIRDTEMLRDELLQDRLRHMGLCEKRARKQGKERQLAAGLHGHTARQARKPPLCGRLHNDPARRARRGAASTDLVAYGGWSMDDHRSRRASAPQERPTIFHPAPSPYGIPVPQHCIRAMSKI